MRSFTPVLLAGLVVTVFGCSSVYQRSHQRLPPEPCERLEMRIEEARQAAQVAESASAGLLGAGEPQPQIVGSGETSRAQFDRAEVAVLDMERRVATAREALAGCATREQPLAEIERLEHRLKEIKARIEAARPAKSQVVR